MRDHRLPDGSLLPGGVLPATLAEVFLAHVPGIPKTNCPACNAGCLHLSRRPSTMWIAI